MNSLFHHGVSKIHFTRSENMPAVRPFFLPKSAMKYFHFIIAGRNNYTVKLIPVLLTLVTTQFINLLYYHKGGPDLTLPKILFFAMLLLAFIGSYFIFIRVQY